MSGARKGNGRLGWREAQGNRNRNWNKCTQKMDETMQRVSLFFV